jgi:predicted nucleic acid-binding protein
VSRQCYLDASALVKLAVPEAQTGALAEYIATRALCTSIVGRVELERAIARRLDREKARAAVDQVLEMMVVLPLDVATAAVASVVAPLPLRSLDAIHLATARALGPDLHSFVCYDVRLSSAALAAGLAVESPA